MEFFLPIEFLAIGLLKPLHDKNRDTKSLKNVYRYFPFDE